MDTQTNPDVEISLAPPNRHRTPFAELFVWFFIATAFIAPTLIKSVYVGYIVIEESDLLLLSFSSLIFLFPTMFCLIFNKFPIETFLKKSAPPNLSTANINNNYDAEDNSIEFRKYADSADTDNSAESYLTDLANNSKKLAKAIFSRAGVFLLIGGLVAFSGLIFFYSITSKLTIEGNPAQLLATLTPNFGILFFIEFIAFFFLRQYRTAMDEFRYYESLQRSREETLAIVKMIVANGEKVDIYQLIEKCGFRSNIEKLENGQTTELLETKKLNKDETEIFNKILDILGKK